MAAKFGDLVYDIPVSLHPKRIFPICKNVL